MNPVTLMNPEKSLHLVLEIKKTNKKNSGTKLLTAFNEYTKSFESIPTFIKYFLDGQLIDRMASVSALKVDP